MVTPLRVDGADLSHHNLDPNLALAKAHNLRFLWHKCTEGATYVDPTYGERRHEARRDGLPFGGYHFASPDGSDARREAVWFLTHATPKVGDLVPALDYERWPSGWSTARMTDWAGRWIAVIRAELGVLPVFYTPFDLEENFGCLLWQPRYNPSNTPPVVAKPWARWDIWQFSNGVTGVPSEHPGLPGNVDLNHMREGLRIRDFRIPDPDPDEPLPMARFRMMTQNVQALPRMPQPDVVEDVRLTASQSGIVCWQEIRLPRYKAAIQGLADFDHYFGRGGTPISWRRQWWDLVTSGETLLHRGFPAITPTQWITWVVLRHKRTGQQIVVHNFHYVAKAWNRFDDPTDPLRKRVWNKANERHRALVASWVSQGLAVAGFGDANRQHGRFHLVGDQIGQRPVTYHVGERSIDIIFLINGAEVRWTDVQAELMPGRNSDHPGRRVRVRLEE